MVEGLGDGRVSGREEMMSGAEGFGGCPSTATKDYEAHSMEFLMKTKNKEEKLEIVRRKAKFDMACYVDSEGLSGGLALWWKEQDGVRIIGKCKNLIDMEVNEESVDQQFRVFWVGMEDDK